MKKLTKKKGFTLVELLVVVAIIAVLMLLALPRFMDSTKGAKVRTFESNFRTIVSAAAQYAALNNGSYIGIKAPSGSSGTAAKTDVEKLADSLAGKPKGATYTVEDPGSGPAPATDKGIKGVLSGAEVGQSGKDYTLTYKYTDATVSKENEVSGVSSSF